MLVQLESVGCVLDTNEFLVYPMYEDGSIDIGNFTELSECTEEWHESLSERDRVTIFFSQVS